MTSSAFFLASRRAILGLGAAAVLAARLSAEERPLTVFAAASLKPALDEIAALWPDPVAISYGGSGTLARQAAVGAPADVILLAATDWMDWLRGQGVINYEPVSVATNHLVFAGPPDAAPLELTRAAILQRIGTARRFAMGDPLSVPAGRYGQQALETLGLWTDLRPRALFAENVRSALAFVARGDVPLGLVYHTDTLGTGVMGVADVPSHTHAPITYPGAVLINAGGAATAFLNHVKEAQDIFAKHGFAA